GLVSFCLPVVTGLLAVIFGFIGLRRARNPSVGGRGPSIAGMILGIISTVLWLAIAVPVGLTWMNSRPQKDLARQFIVALSNNDISAADKVSASTMGWDHMVELSDRLTTLGQFRDVRFYSYSYHIVNGVEQWTLTGDA